MTKTTKTGGLLILGVILTTVFFFISVRKNTPPSFEEIFSQGKTTVETAEEIKTPTVTIADPQKGPRDAQITIIEFADYGCAYCAEVNKILNEILTKYPKDVRVIWKDYPFLPPLEATWKSHIAARCAGKQNKFWEFHDFLFENQNNLSEAQFLEIAKILNINLPLFETCLKNEETRPLVQKSFQEGQDVKIDGTPTFYINGQKSNNISLEIIEGLIIK